MSLIPAKELGAVYNPTTSVLTLFARGEVNVLVRGIYFKRDPWIGGLRFSLLGFDAIDFGCTLLKHYSISRRVDIPNLNRIAPSNEIIIEDCEHPNGLIVPVHWLGYGESEPTNLGLFSTSQFKAAPTPASPPQISSSDPIEIIAFIGQEFQIKEILPQSPTGTLDVDFDSYHLKMVNADVKQGSLNWYFKPIEGGTSRVTVDLVPSHPKPGELGLALIQKTYIVKVAWLTADSESQGKAGKPSGSLSAPSGDGEILSFLGRVNKAVNIVRKARPDLDPELIYVGATNLYVIASIGPGELAALVCIFRTKEGLAMIHSRGWGEWDAPYFLEDLPPFGIKPFALEGLKDIQLAIQAMREKHIYGRIERASLSEYLPPPQILEEQPFYEFTFFDGRVVRVGARDLNVGVPGPDSAKEKPNGA